MQSSHEISTSTNSQNLDEFNIYLGKVIQTYPELASLVLAAFGPPSVADLVGLCGYLEALGTVPHDPYRVCEPVPIRDFGTWKSEYACGYIEGSSYYMRPLSYHLPAVVRGEITSQLEPGSRHEEGSNIPDFSDNRLISFANATFSQRAFHQPIGNKLQMADKPDQGGINEHILKERDLWNPGHVAFSVLRSWSGLESCKNIVAFGDSYTSGSHSGDPVSVNGGYPWVEQMVASMHDKQKTNIKLYNYAQPGNSVQDDLAYQLSRYFVDFPKKNKPISEPCLPPAETLYILWLGINDCGSCMEDEIEDIVETLFDALHDLYVKAGARSFLLIDIPPLDRTPGAADVTINLNENCQTWNDELLRQCNELASESTMASVFLFSSYALLTEILDDPTLYDFTEDDVEQMDGGIWADGLHPTQEMHAIIADAIEASLSSISIST